MEHLEAIEKRLWSAADTLRANSNYASNEYFLPVMGLIFLRHAYSRYLGVRDQIVASLPSRGGVTRALTKADFSCAVKRRCLSAGANPARQLSLRPVATGAVVEVTKRLKPLV